MTGIFKVPPPRSVHYPCIMFGLRNVSPVLLLCLCGLGALVYTSALSAPDPKLQANVGKKQPITPPTIPTPAASESVDDPSPSPADPVIEEGEVVVDEDELSHLTTAPPLPEAKTAK